MCCWQDGKDKEANPEEDDTMETRVPRQYDPSMAINGEGGPRRHAVWREIWASTKYQSPLDEDDYCWKMYGMWPWAFIVFFSRALNSRAPHLSILKMNERMSTKLGPGSVRPSTWVHQARRSCHQGRVLLELRVCIRIMSLSWPAWTI